MLPDIVDVHVFDVHGFNVILHDWLRLYEVTTTSSNINLGSNNFFKHGPKHKNIKQLYHNQNRVAGDVCHLQNTSWRIA